MNQLELKMKKYVRSGYNILLTGESGVGKTAMIQNVFSDVFGEKDVKWKYFSVPTMDPWIDFIGIPKSYTSETGEEVFGIVPPKEFSAENEIEALFFDEINRAGDPKIMNALMELIQFKSINGRKFPNLKTVCAAENPGESDIGATYQVLPLDTAHRDRFHVQLKIPYDLNLDYLKAKYDDEVVDIASRWWKSNRKPISPRRLDLLLEAHVNGFTLTDFYDDRLVVELQDGLQSSAAFSAIENALDTMDKALLDEMVNLNVLRENELRFTQLPIEKLDVISHLPNLDKETKEYLQFKIIPKVRSRLDNTIPSGMDNIFPISKNGVNPVFSGNGDITMHRFDSAESAWGSAARLLRNLDINSYHLLTGTEHMSFLKHLQHFPDLSDEGFNGKAVDECIGDLDVYHKKDLKFWFCSVVCSLRWINLLVDNPAYKNTLDVSNIPLRKFCSELFKFSTFRDIVDLNTSEQSATRLAVLKVLNCGSLETSFQILKLKKYIETGMER